MPSKAQEVPQRNKKETNTYNAKIPTFHQKLTRWLCIYYPTSL